MVYLIEGGAIMGTTKSSKLSQHLHIVSPPKIYTMLDKITNESVMRVKMNPKASEELNAELRIALANVYYDYGRKIGIYK